MVTTLRDELASLKIDRPDLGSSGGVNTANRSSAGAGLV